jgi:hypothetical protein
LLPRVWWSALHSLKLAGRPEFLLIDYTTSDVSVGLRPRRGMHEAAASTA